MSRLLPILIAQVPSRDPASAVSELRAELLELLEDFPASRMVIYPEFHTCRVSGGPVERERGYRTIAEPIDGPRLTALRGVAREARVWLGPGTIIEQGAASELFNTAVALSPDGERPGRWSRAGRRGCTDRTRTKAPSRLPSDHRPPRPSWPTDQHKASITTCAH